MLKEGKLRNLREAFGEMNEFNRIDSIPKDRVSDPIPDLLYVLYTHTP